MRWVLTALSCGHAPPPHHLPTWVQRRQHQQQQRRHWHIAANEWQSIRSPVHLSHNAGPSLSCRPPAGHTKFTLSWGDRPCHHAALTVGALPLGWNPGGWTARSRLLLPNRPSVFRWEPYVLATLLLYIVNDSWHYCCVSNSGWRRMVFGFSENKYLLCNTLHFNAQHIEKWQNVHECK